MLNSGSEQEKDNSITFTQFAVDFEILINIPEGEDSSVTKSHAVRRENYCS